VVNDWRKVRWTIELYVIQTDLISTKDALHSCAAPKLTRMQRHIIMSHTTHMQLQAMTEVQQSYNTTHNLHSAETENNF